MKSGALLGALLGLLGTACHRLPTGPVAAIDAASLPVEIAATDLRVEYEGRWDMHDPAGPRCGWPASMVHLRFRGSAMNLSLQETTGSDEYQVEVDGVSQPRVVSSKGKHLYRIFEGSPGEHAVTVCKRTEGKHGQGQVLGFQVPAESEVGQGNRQLRRRLEVIGDSIACGTSAVAAGEEGLATKGQNAWLGFGAMAARALKAEYACIAASGRCMAGDEAIGAVYDQSLPQDSRGRWDFNSWTPDTVVIALGTNDFQKSIPKKAAWCQAYKAFLARLRRNYPSSQFLCASSAMLAPEPSANLQEYLQTIVAEMKAGGDRHIHYLDFSGAFPGATGERHPDAAAHARMAEALVQRVQSLESP